MCARSIFWWEITIIVLFFFLVLPMKYWNTVKWQQGFLSARNKPFRCEKNTPSSKSFHLLWKTLPYLLGTSLIMLLFSSLILKNHIWLAILQLGMYIEKCNAYCLTWFFCQKLCVAASRSWLGPRNSSVKLQTCFQKVLPQSPCNEWMSQIGLEEGDAAHFPKRLLLLTSLPYN